MYTYYVVGQDGKELLSGSHANEEVLRKIIRKQIRSVLNYTERTSIKHFSENRQKNGNDTFVILQLLPEEKWTLQKTVIDPAVLPFEEVQKMLKGGKVTK